MDENMNNVEVSAEVSGAEEATQEFEYDETTSRPSKGFVGLAITAGAAVIGGTVALVVRHKNKKKAIRAAEEINKVSEEVLNEEDTDEGLEQEEESEEKPAKKK